MSAQTIVILGGGVGGLVAANELARLLPEKHRIVLVERSRRHAFAPSFLWLMTGARRTGQITRDVRTLVPRRVEIVQAEAQSIDWARGQIGTGAGAIAYDHLVIALGAELTAVQPRHHGPDGTPQGLGQLPVAQALDVDEDEWNPIRLGDADEPAAHVLVAELVQEVLVQPVRVRQRILVHDPVVEREAIQVFGRFEGYLPSRGPASIDDEPAQNLEEPRANAVRVPERDERLQALQVGLLHEVFGGRSVAGQPQGQAIEGPQVGERALLEPSPVHDALRP